MQNKFTINEFEKITGISKSKLRYYDAWGILGPEIRGENDYRLYSQEQIDIAWVIESLREMRVPLKTIKSYLENRSVPNARNLFETKINEIDDEIKYLNQLKSIILELMNGIDLSKSVKPGDFQLIQKEPETIYLGKVVDDIRSNFSQVVSFVQFCRKHNIASCSRNINYLLPRESLSKRRWEGPGQLYIRSPEGNELIDGGLYLVVFDYLTNVFSGLTFRKIFQYIDENPLLIAGNTYVDCIIGETESCDPNNFLMKVSVRVQEK